MKYSSFTEMLVRERTLRGLTQQDLAKALGEITASAIASYEAQGRMPKPAMIVKICKFFGVAHEPYIDAYLHVKRNRRGDL